MLCFDWVVHTGDVQPGDADLTRDIALPPDAANVRDRYRLSRASRAGTRTTSFAATT